MIRSLSLQALRLVAAVVASFGALGVCFAPVVLRPYGFDYAVGFFLAAVVSLVFGLVFAVLCTHKLES